MFQSIDQVLNHIEKYQVEMVDLKFCDLWGRWHHLTVPAKQFNPDLLDKGIGFDGSAVGLKSVKAGDMVLVPDLNTAFMDPFGMRRPFPFYAPPLKPIPTLFSKTILVILHYVRRISSSQRE